MLGTTRNAEWGSRILAMNRTKEPTARGRPKRNTTTHRKKRGPYLHPKSETRPDTEWLKDQIELSRMSQRAIARMLGLDPPKLSRTISGGRRILVQELINLAGILGIPFDMLLAKFGYPTAAMTMRRDKSRK